VSPVIQSRPGYRPPSRLRHAVFDWDGTLSFIRAGWGEVMLELFLSHLPALPGEDAAKLRHQAHDDIWRLNGKPTIHQMQCLAERVVERGGERRPAVAYQSEYATRLRRMVDARIEEVRSGSRSAAAYQPPGTVACLEALSAAGLILHVVSGTEARHVNAEVEVLGVSRFFGPRVHGPSGPEDRSYSKRGVMDAILASDGAAGDALVVFGDGHVEIEEAKAMGATAVAVATDEEVFGSGRIDEAKRQRLWGVGADMVVPDYARLDEILGGLGLVNREA
jgi:phosphoglycolate phosphatase